MNGWQALILGIVEGVTEYLPISSTGHLIITSWLMGLMKTQGDSDKVFTFNIVIQAGAIAAVLGLYWPRVKQMTLGLMGRNQPGLRLTINLLIAFLPAAILGLLFRSLIKQYLNGLWPVIWALFIGAWLMLGVAYRRKRLSVGHQGKNIDDLTWKISLLIGLSQCVAMWPGTSRSMMTIVAALMLGLHPRAAAEFSFLLGLVTLTAATGYEAIKDGSEMLEMVGISSLIIGFVAATISAALAIKWFVTFLTRHGLAPFGWYRLALAAVLAGLLSTGAMTLADDTGQPQEAPSATAPSAP